MFSTTYKDISFRLMSNKKPESSNAFGALQSRRMLDQVRERISVRFFYGFNRTEIRAPAFRYRYKPCLSI